MKLKYDKDQLTSILNDFHNITGLNIMIKDTDYNTIGRNEEKYPEFCNIIQSCKKGKANCICSDRALFKKCSESMKTEIHTCHAGLTDIAVPLIKNETVIAYIILGQIKNNVSFESILNKTEPLDCDKKLLKESYAKLISFNRNKINSISNIALMLAEHILLNNMLRPVSDTHVQKSIDYINKNITEQISVSNICKEINISKSVLFKSFKERLNATPNQYINQKKIEKAKELIITTDLTVKEVAYYLGFTNVTYFYKLFKKITGDTPFQFKKLQK